MPITNENNRRKKGKNRNSNIILKKIFQSNSVKYINRSKIDKILLYDTFKTKNISNEKKMLYYFNIFSQYYQKNNFINRY